MSGRIVVEAKIINPKVGREFPPPTYATDGSAGMDLRACIDSPLTIAPGGVEIVGAGIAISIRDPSYMAMLAPRSGLGIKHGVVLANLVGVVDSDYQNEIRIALWNRGSESFIVSPGERICQMLFVPVARAELKIVDEFSAITERGLGGLGSTGRF